VYFDEKSHLESMLRIVAKLLFIRSIHTCTEHTLEDAQVLLAILSNRIFNAFVLSEFSYRKLTRLGSCTSGIGGLEKTSESNDETWNIDESDWLIVY
jgi:hypothetical protein